MPFVKVHMSERSIEEAGEGLAEELRKGMVEVLGIRHDHGHVVIYGSPVHRRGIHESRNRNFVFVEINMFSGRSAKMKEELFHRISGIIHDRTGISESDILLNIVDTDRGDWAVRGGVPMDKLELGS
jgi:phenylpyruvate tautomerase PptA (4-oxalocrotonate tautomerase family)